MPENRAVAEITRNWRERLELTEYLLIDAIAQLRAARVVPHPAGLGLDMVEVEDQLSGQLYQLRLIRVGRHAAGCPHNIGSTDDVCPRCRKAVR